MVSSFIEKNEESFIDEDGDVSHEKHKQLLQTITSKTKRKYVPTYYFMKYFSFLLT